jgi:hypothetical protein
MDDLGVTEHITEEVEKKAREEFNFLHKQICPSCRRRILKSV